MPDLIMYVKCIYPDGSTSVRRGRLPADGAFEVRLRFHDGKLAKAHLLRQVRLSEEGRLELSQGGIRSAPASDHPDTPIPAHHS